MPSPLFAIRWTPEKQAEAEEDVFPCRRALWDLPWFVEKEGWSPE
jgi:hypothetical protein